MKSDDITVQQLFQDRRQYMVPFYQRSYVWTRNDQWGPLWEDIKDKAESRLMSNKNIHHFLGAVVFDPQPRNGLIGVDTLHIIDGQQRLTTLQFILKSIILALNIVGSTQISEIVSQTLKNSNPDTMRDPEIEVFKVWPTFRDRDDYRSVLNAKNQEELKKIFPKSFTLKETLKKIGVWHPRPLEAIWFFTENFKHWIKKDNDSTVSIRAEAIVTAILQDIKVVSIVLDEDDDAQVIFETLNGRGAQLHATDLIRNFIFMRADREGSDSEQLYESLWKNFENSYWNQTQRRGRLNKPRIEWFIQACLQAELREEIDLGRLYFEYRRFVFNGVEPILAKQQLDTLTEYAELYKQLINGVGDSPLANFGRRILPYDITTVHSLALMIGGSILDEDKQNEMFDLLISYIVRRLICGLTSKNYNNIFVSIIRSLSKSEISPVQLKKILCGFTSETSRWPKDEEFKSVCETAPIYPEKIDPPKMRGVLAELELQLRQMAQTEDSFSKNLGDLDVDHILPRSWFQYWPLADGTTANQQDKVAVIVKKLAQMELSEKEQAILAREGCISTLGNLTLLNFRTNRQAQHKAFVVKKDLLLQNTNLRLNVPLVGMEEWDEESIKKRGKDLAKAALKVWPGVSAE